jgi:hypothetical protein
MYYGILMPIFYIERRKCVVLMNALDIILVPGSSIRVSSQGWLILRALGGTISFDTTGGSFESGLGSGGSWASRGYSDMSSDPDWYLHEYLTGHWGNMLILTRNASLNTFQVHFNYLQSNAQTLSKVECGLHFLFCVTKNYLQDIFHYSNQRENIPNTDRIYHDGKGSPYQSFGMIKRWTWYSEI